MKTIEYHQGWADYSTQTLLRSCLYLMSRHMLEHTRQFKSVGLDGQLLSGVAQQDQHRCGHVPLRGRRSSSLEACLMTILM